MKKFEKAGTLLKNASDGAVRPGRRTARYWITLLGLGMSLGSLTLPASADTAIYFYTQTGVENVSAYYSIGQHYLYDTLNYNAIVGTVDDQGRIYDLSDQLIGYVDAGPQGGVP